MIRQWRDGGGNCSLIGRKTQKPRDVLTFFLSVAERAKSHTPRTFHAKKAGPPSRWWREAEKTETDSYMKITVVGTGAWGTALAIHFAKHGNEVLSTSIDDETIEEMASTRKSGRLLPGFDLPESLKVAKSEGGMRAPADLMIVATPVVGLRPTLEIMKKVNPSMPMLFACKGFENGTGLLPHEVAKEVLPDNPKVGILSGPSFAQEVAMQLPAAIVVASSESAWIDHVAKELNTPVLRLYASTDPTGASVGGAVKNVMAIATGIVDGLSYGLNARAALITRGLAEMTRLALALGASRDTMMGLAGMGDLILTCTGNLSRNRNVGLQLAKGKNLDIILEELGHVAEGVNTVKEVVKCAERMGVEMPITNILNELLEGKKTATEAVDELMSRSPKFE